MSTITSVEQLLNVPEETWLIYGESAFPAAWAKGHVTAIIVDRGRNDDDARRLGWLPAQTLHPRTISADELERAARVMYERRPYPEVTWSYLDRGVRAEYLADTRAALTALGFEVTE